MPVSTSAHFVTPIGVPTLMPGVLVDTLPRESQSVGQSVCAGLRVERRFANESLLGSQVNKITKVALR